MGNLKTIRRVGRQEASAAAGRGLAEVSLPTSALHDRLRAALAGAGCPADEAAVLLAEEAYRDEMERLGY